jgi:hypothetical protein
MKKGNATPILVDAHVHFYDCFDISVLLDAVLLNFDRAAHELGIGSDFTAVLLLAETSREHWFERVRKSNGNGEMASSPGSQSQWEFYKTPDKAVIHAKKVAGNTASSRVIHIMAGKQLATSEGLEVLALATVGLFEEYQSTSATIKQIREQDAIPVIPWAVGKWLGKRGKLLTDLLDNESHSDLCVGDNSGRPVFWRNPAHFKQAELNAMHLLPGTDPLPFSIEAGRVGSFGFMVKGGLSNEDPSGDIKRILRERDSKLVPFGDLESPWRFLRNQIQLRMK